MSQAGSLAPTEVAVGIGGSPPVATFLGRILPLGWSDVGLFRALAGLAFGVTLAIAPFEAQLFSLRTDVLTFTDLELAATLTLVAWAALLAAERRLPDVPRGVAVAVGLMALLSVASAVAASTFGGEALRFAVRSLGFWLLFVGAADMVRTERAAVRLLAWVLAGAAISACIGWVTLIVGSASGLPGPGRLFTVGGVARAAGTFDYPNTAAAYWEMTLLAGLPLVLLPNRRAARIVVATALFAVGGAMLLTYSRGALIGALCGIAALAGMAFIAGRMRGTGVGRLAGVAAVALLAGGVVVQVAGSLPLARLIADSDQGLYGAQYEAPATIDLKPGDETQVPIALTNTGQATWRAAGPDAFNLSYHWIDPQTGAIAMLDGARTPFPTDVAPGARIELMATVVAPATAGEYLLTWDVAQEGVTWFSEKHVPTATTAVMVGGAAPAAVSGGGSLELFGDVMPVPSRGELWSAALTMIRDAPLLGVGPGTYRLRYGAVLGWPRWDDRVHSNDLYLELGATTGLLGLVAFLVLTGAALLWQVRPLLRRTTRAVASAPSLGDQAWALRAGLVAAMAAFLVHGVVDYFLGFAPTAILFWSLLGIGLGLAIASRARSADREPEVVPDGPAAYGSPA